MRILGIDPGTKVTGYGLVGEENHQIYLIGAGAIKTSERHTLPKRLRRIFEGLSEVIHQFQPDAVAVENTFLSNNFASALKLGQACGVALLAAELAGLPVYDYTPAEIKLAVVGHGSAEKEQVQHMVHRLLDLNSMALEGSHHATDALAVGICHLHSRGLREVELANRSLKTPSTRIR